MSMHRNRTLEARWVANAAAYGIRDQGPDPELGQHGHGQRQLGLPDDPPGAVDRRRGNAGPLDPLPGRRRDAARRRDDPARGDARRPDRLRAVRRSVARRRGVARVPRRVLDRPSATIRCGAPRWTLGCEPAAPPARRRLIRRPVSADRPSPEDFVAERPHDPDDLARRRPGCRPTAGTTISRRSATSSCRPTSARPPS